MARERAAALAVFGLIACSAEAPEVSSIDGGPAVLDAANEGPADGGVADDSAPRMGVSTKGRVRFKGARRFARDLARALELDPGRVCLELGQYDCVGAVHTIALGGVEPYVLGVFAPTPETTATAPLAVERVVLSACGSRVDEDLAASEPLLFEGISSEPSEALRAAAVERLYRRALLRDPSSAERSALVGLFDEIAADGLPDAARDWAVLSCFTVLTGLEALFY